MLIQVFLLSFGISLLGTIPPATINITVMQLSLTMRAKSAFLLSLGAVIVDTFYAGLAVRIQIYLSQKIEFTNYFYLIAAIVLVVLGIISLLSKPSHIYIDSSKTRQVGFVKGLLLGALNPLAMPFWLGVTTYLQLNGLIDLSGLNYWSYIIGVFLGELVMLMIIVKIGGRFTHVSSNRMIVNFLPGVAFLILGILNFGQWLSFYF